MSTMTFREALQAAVDEKGADYVYPRGKRGWTNVWGMCRYAVNGKPACIIGDALHRMGVPISTLKEFDANEEGVDAATALEESGLNPTAAEKRGVNAAQSRQDSGASWGESIRAYDIAAGVES